MYTKNKEKHARLCKQKGYVYIFSEQVANLVVTTGRVCDPHGT